MKDWFWTQVYAHPFRVIGVAWVLFATLFVGLNVTADLWWY